VLPAYLWDAPHVALLGTSLAFPVPVMAKRRAEDSEFEGSPPFVPALPPAEDPSRTAPLPWYGPGYSTAPKEDGGGFWGGVLDVVTAPVKAVVTVAAPVVRAVETVAAPVVRAVEAVAAPVVNAAEAVVDVARDSVVGQAILAASTGGLSLVAQAAIETATGKGGPITRLAEQIVTDPLDVVKSLPGVALTELGAVGLVADAVSYAGAAVEGAFGESSPLAALVLWCGML
jgi:hypothetical protein